MFGGERDSYNPYAEGGGSDGYERPHGHHHFGHHREDEEPQYGDNLERRPPPRPDYGYGGGPYGDEERRSNYHEERRHDEYDDRQDSSMYPSGPNPYGPGAEQQGASGHSYGDQAYHTSPYTAASGIRQHGHGRDEPPNRNGLPGVPVRLHCKADPDFSLAVVPGQGPVMTPTDPRDDYQVWYKDETMATRVKDETGAPSFCLINKATGQALQHAPEDLEQCLLGDYDPTYQDDSLWWTMSDDIGQGYRCIRMAGKISRNLDVLHGDENSGGVKEGSPVITFAWKKQDNQIWKATPA